MGEEFIVVCGEEFGDEDFVAGEQFFEGSEGITAGIEAAALDIGEEVPEGRVVEGDSGERFIFEGFFKNLTTVRGGLGVIVGVYKGEDGVRTVAALVATSKVEDAYLGVLDVVAQEGIQDSCRILTGLEVELREADGEDREEVEGAGFLGNREDVVIILISWNRGELVSDET